jgi:uncharacterized protein YbgA (DUF1722 family)/uncharacterized protein YbbK (DUF523 family)
VRQQVAPLAVKIGISACLLGQNVRYDGGHKRHRFITGTLSKYFEFVPVCPEMEIGLGVPRDPIRLVGKPGAIRVVGTVDPRMDVTKQLRSFGTQTARRLNDISGYIFKGKSPSCGTQRVKLYPEDGNTAPSNAGIGQYAQAVMAYQPNLPVEEGECLNDPALKDNFIERVFTYKRWQDLRQREVTVARLVDFHTRHKLAILAHDQAAYAQLGKLLAEAGNRELEEVADEYIYQLMKTLKRPATRNNHINVLQYILDDFKVDLDRDDKAEMVEVNDQYCLGQVPLIVPVTLIKHHLRKHPNPEIDGQVYLNPHPAELMLRNLI